MKTSLNIQMHETYSTTSFGIADLSVYQASPSNISFEIQAPGWNKVNATFTPSQVNIFTSDDFNIQCDSTSPLPDGEYVIRYSVLPNQKSFIEKSFFRTSLIRCKYKKALLAIDDECSCNGASYSDMRKSLTEIRILIEGALASAEQCDLKGAMRKYKLADARLSRISNCGCN